MTRRGFLQALLSSSVVAFVPTFLTETFNRITIDPTQGNVFRLINEQHKLNISVKPSVNGQRITIAHKAVGRDGILKLDTGVGGFRFGTHITTLTPTTNGKTDFIDAVYNATDNKWHIISYVKGF